MHETDVELLTTDDLAAELCMHPVTLAQWRLIAGKGPTFVKLGGAVRYRRSDVREWLETCSRRTTSAG